MGFYQLNIKYYKKMPQFVPFYFINQISSIYFFLIVFVYVLYRYLLPNTLVLLLTRFTLLNRITLKKN